MGVNGVTLEWIRFGIVAALLVCGMFTMFVAVLGVYRFRFALNRMHSASIGDSLGLPFVLLAVAVSFGIDWAVLKLILIVAVMWLTSPISAHLISKLEAMTDPRLKEHLTIQKLEKGGDE
jgi:multicomponent Na+:H+ antiporter subunit G